MHHNDYLLKQVDKAAEFIALALSKAGKATSLVEIDAAINDALNGLEPILKLPLSDFLLLPAAEFSTHLEKLALSPQALSKLVELLEFEHKQPCTSAPANVIHLKIRAIQRHLQKKHKVYLFPQGLPRKR